MNTYNFHVRKNVRIRYNLEESLFTLTGNLIITNNYQARLLSKKINDARIEEGKADQLVSPGMLNGLGLLHEIFHFLIRHYEEKENPGVFKRSLEHLSQNIGREHLDRLLIQYLNDFPTVDILRNKITPEEYLAGTTAGKLNSEIVIEELILLHLENENPAAILLEELFSDKDLALKTSYLNFINETEKFFVTEKPFGADNLPLIHFLKIPLTANPLSIEAQLEFIRKNWGVYVYQIFNDRLLSGRDLIKEDERYFIKHFGFGKPSPPVPAYEFNRDYFEMLRRKFESGQLLSEAELQYYHSETERFSEDIDWMPRVVMIAKNVFVWLFQLSGKYGREINRLDQIPDEELDILAKWNFTALWLIGIWERSTASKKIKQSMGNPEAAASAYSLYDYVIAEELGGEQAFENLKRRAWKRGIRMASDMVPNHTGIFSKWVIEKPEYFIQSDNSPYPSYSFHSSNLSDDPRVEVRIEDKYYNHSDAAVVFQRRDSYTGSVTYIYHGNDGTHMPWNDTAQLNLLNPELREALIQTIMHVARKTPIIRFDAAMTLTKKHFQRLWFPIPGTGSGVPSRSDHSMTRSQFDEALPVEFWREVVDRINKELPNTLLLAEAFWLMESYFVRTLGMHRVYNSAFMHMFMKEENEKYRLLVKNTLSFNPEILKRYVNFMSNPDEETAVNQFGKGDKYFGAVVVMVTLPGLPMFGHGQIEGFAEKYGMEYKRSYYDEPVDEYLVHRHEAELFPLMSKRYLFSQVQFFEFYDMIDDNGNVVENVFAYSNRLGSEKALIIYNNSYTETRGNVRYPVHKNASAPEIKVHSKLGDALDIKPEWKVFYIYKDYRSNLEYLISGYDLMENGLFVYLSGYQYYAFLDFREVYDHQGDYEHLRIYLSGRGVPSIQYAMEELKLMPFHSTVKHLMSDYILNEMKVYTAGDKKVLAPDVKILFRSLLDSINHYENIHFDADAAFSGILGSMKIIREINVHIKEESGKTRKPLWMREISNIKLNNDLIFPYLILFQISRDSDVKNIFKKIKMNMPLYDSINTDNTRKHIPLLDALSSGDISPAKKKFLVPGEEVETVNAFFKNDKICSWLNVNTWEGITYYSKENFEELIRWLQTLDLLHHINRAGKTKTGQTKKNQTSKQIDKGKLINNNLKTGSETASNILKASDSAGYRTDVLLMNLVKLSPASEKKSPVEKNSSNKVTPIKKSSSKEISNKNRKDKNDKK